jgi:hypothetical protein
MLTGMMGKTTFNLETRKNPHPAAEIITALPHPLAFRHSP